MNPHIGPILMRCCAKYMTASPNSSQLPEAIPAPDGDLTERFRAYRHPTCSRSMDMNRDKVEGEDTRFHQIVLGGLAALLATLKAVHQAPRANISHAASGKEAVLVYVQPSFQRRMIRAACPTCKFVMSPRDVRAAETPDQLVPVAELTDRSIFARRHAVSVTGEFGRD